MKSCYKLTAYLEISFKTTEIGFAIFDRMITIASKNGADNILHATDEAN